MVSLLINFIPKIFSKLYTNYWSSTFLNIFIIIISISILCTIIYYFLPYKRFSEKRKITLFYSISVILSIVSIIIFFFLGIGAEYKIKDLIIKFFFIIFIDITIFTNLFVFNLLSYININKIKLKRYFVRKKLSLGILK